VLHHADRRYVDRAEAGAVLARLLNQLLTEQLAETVAPDLLVLGLPRGGIPVAGPVAAALGAPLDVLLVRKVGLPEQPELAMGAVAMIGGRSVAVRNVPVLQHCRKTDDEFGAACRAELDTLGQQAVRYRHDREPLEPAGRLVIVVDDGLATGATMRAAVAALRSGGVKQLLLAVPIGSPTACQALAARVDGLICPWQPPDFHSVSQGYRDFGQTSEAEVIRILAESGAG
jgi:putative phosphoribosyl transferase